MKLIREEISGSDKKRMLFALGTKEAELILGCLIKAKRNFPAGKRWKPDALRMKNIVKIIGNELYAKKGKSDCCGATIRYPSTEQACSECDLSCERVE